MNKRLSRLVSVAMSVVLAGALVPSAALAATQDDEEEQQAAQGAGVVAESSAMDALSAEATTIEATTTVDEDGNVIESTVCQDGQVTVLTEDDSEEDAEDDDSEEEYTTTYTYKLKFAASTRAVSSSNSAVKTVRVSKPKLTTTTTVKDSDGNVVSQTSTTKTYGLTVKVAVRGKGWKTASTTSDGVYAYTASKASSGNYISAVRVTPSDNLKKAMKTAGLSFVYRVKTKYFGTLGWARAGWAAGTTGNNCAMTGIELKIVSSSKLSSYSTTNRYISQPIVTYKTKYTGASSWSASKTNGATAGKTASSKTVGSVAIKLSSAYTFSGSIKYSVRSSKTDSSSNWSSWKTDYATAGSGSYANKAIRIKLTGTLAKKYDVYYRVYVKGFGWLGWAKNGAKAGTKNVSGGYSALQVRLVPKGSGAPGSTAYSYVSSSTTKMAMVLKAQSRSSSTKYLILVDRSACRVGIFTGSKGNWTLKHYWKCCVGKSSTPTIKGSYTVGSKGYSFGTSSYTCYYYTQISGNYLFHSVLYYAGTKTIKDGTMGKAVSHGCVRLTIDHAKWIYDNVKRGSKIYIY